jgi:hypothetical protein
MTLCAASWLFQKDSVVIWASSSARRWFNLATSKKPPQMGEFVGGGGDLWFDEVEHGTRSIAERGGRMKDGKWPGA